MPVPLLTSNVWSPNAAPSVIIVFGWIWLRSGIMSCGLLTAPLLAAVEASKLAGSVAHPERIFVGVAQLVSAPSNASKGKETERIDNVFCMVLLQGLGVVPR